MKERLVELMRAMNTAPELTCPRYNTDETCKGCKYEKDGDCDFDEREADYLLAKGVFVPPCKVGDKVYYVSKNPLNLSVQANTIYEADVVRIVTTHLGTTLVIHIHNEYGCTEIPDIHEWQQVVFPTREEAKAKLKEGAKMDSQ